MNEGRERLSLNRNKGPAKPRFFAGGRYATSTVPRAGGIASIYRGREIESGKQVAIKVFRDSTGIDDVVNESFRREVRALSDLKHENIVRILDSGRDEDTGEHFIVMEWVESDLESVRHGRQFNGWDEYYSEIGRPILQALAFAHSKSIVHRDIKPSNILMGQDGSLRVCDFGISKLRSFIDPGVTLAHFASVPYAPPEQDDGSYSYSRDVFGFAALSVVMLGSDEVRTHSDIHKALEYLKIEESIRRILRKSLSLENPSDRPTNAVVLLAEFDRIQPRVEQNKKGTIYIALTKKVRDLIAFDIGIGGEEQLGRYVINDLEDAYCEYAKNQQGQSADEKRERSIRLLGERYGYIAAADEANPSTLTLVTAIDFPVSEMERNRENALPLNYKLAFGGISRLESASCISELREQLSEFTTEQKLKSIEQQQQQLFRTWLDLLSAQAELENTRKKVLGYEQIGQVGSLIEFKIKDGSDALLLEDKDIKVDGVDGAFLGSVVGLSGQIVRVQPSERNRIDPSNLPARGNVVVDTSRSDAALGKQKAAVEAVRYGRSVDMALGSYIMDPSIVLVPLTRDVEFIQTKIDEDKQDAVRTAVSGPALMVVEGPPGTGKTTFITELVLQALRENPASRILLTSQTHVALDNSLEQIIKEGGGNIRAVRIGHDSDEKIAATSKSLLVDRRLPAMRKEAIERGRAFIERWASEHGVDLPNTRMAMVITKHAGMRDRLQAIDTQIEQIRGLSQEEQEALEAEARNELEEQLGALISERGVLEKDIKESVAEFRKYEQDKETVQHLSECSAAELRSWADTYAPQNAEGKQLKKILAVHADWETRFGRGREFRAALIASSNVVAGTCLGVMAIPGRNEISYDLCIVDEASIATPTQVLVPMSRARRTVLVGDNKQLSPFQDPDLRSQGLLKKYGLSQADQQTTLFKHLTECLPPELHKTLKSQHRMIPEIGNMISECFYGGQLKSFVRSPDPLLAAVLPKAVIWKSTSRVQNRGSRKVGTSHYNDLEIKLVERLMTKIDFEIQHGKRKGEKRSIAVLTGYGEQKKRLQTAIDTRRHSWTSYSQIFVNVVDAFQGREADLTIFSVTRSDVEGLGFLREMERINVALSRAKERLVIVGDHLYCLQAAGAENPLKDVISYMERHRDTCVIEEVRP